MQKLQGWAEQGNTQLLIGNAAGVIARKVQGSFPGATVTVFINNPNAAAISSIIRAANIVTVTAGSGYVAGHTVTISGVLDTSFNGTFTILTVGAGTFTYAQAGSNASSSAGSAMQLATIYADNSLTAKSNPFTSGSDGTWFFYAANGRYDVQFSGGGLSAPFTIGDLEAFDPVNAGNPFDWIDVTVAPYLADATGASDAITAFQAAANAVPNGGYIRVPHGRYLLSNQVLFPFTGTSIMGDGQRASIIHFVPSGNASCFKFQAATAVTIAQCRISGLGFDATGETLHTKTAIEIGDAEEMEISDVAVQNWNDAGKTSVGIRSRGRQSLKLDRLTIFAPRPIVLSKNVHAPAPDADHYAFSNLYLLADMNPVLDVDDDVNLTNFSLSGYQAYVFGTHAIRWAPTTETIAGYAINIHNVRWEQGQGNSSNYAMILAPSQGCYGLNLYNCYVGGNPVSGLIAGYYIRNVAAGSMIGCVFSSAPPTGITALNIDSTVRSMHFIGNFFFANGGSVLQAAGAVECVWLGNDVSGNIGIGTGPPTNRLLLPNNQYLAGMTVGGVEKQMIGLNASGVIEMGSDGALVQIDTVIHSGKIVSGSNHAPIALGPQILIPVSNYYGSVDTAGTGEISLIGVNGSASDSIFIGNQGTQAIQLGLFVIANGATPATIGNVGAAGGPATAAQNGWLKVLDGAGNPVWLPVWR